MKIQPPVMPAEGVARMLTVVDEQMAQVQGESTIERTMAASAFAQVYATCALVHAVRELTQAVRDLKETR